MNSWGLEAKRSHLRYRRVEEQLYTKAKVAKGREKRAAYKTLSADRALAWHSGSPGLDSRYKTYAVVHTYSPNTQEFLEGPVPSCSGYLGISRSVWAT